MVQAASLGRILPPTVSGIPLIGNAAAFLSAQGIPIEFLRTAQHTYGDLYHFKVLNQSFYLVADPDLAREILLERISDFPKLETNLEKPRGLARFLGQGILTAQYEEWRPQRKVIQPLMHAKYIAQYADTMAQMGMQLLASWQGGTARDIHADMTLVTMWIIARTMFGIDLQDSASLEEVASEAQKIVIADLLSPLPAWLTGRDEKTNQLNSILTGLVTRFVTEHQKRDSTERNDLLALLLASRDENGQAMSDELLRDNILTMFFAGHETTANTLTWAFYYLAQYPEVLAELQKEVDAVLSGERLPNFDDLGRLPYTLMVIKETMRIMPTVSTFPRQLMVDTHLGNYQLKAPSSILISPYLLHHDKRYWQEPELFNPQRFSAENEAQIPKYAYLPFGGGPRICIGNHFALMEAQILLALIVSRYHLRLSPNTKIDTIYHITAYPKDGLMLQLEERK